MLAWIVFSLALAFTLQEPTTYDDCLEQEQWVQDYTHTSPSGKRDRFPNERSCDEKFQD